MATLKTNGLDALIHKLGSLSAIDFTPLMLEWEDILDADNERGVLAGLDGWGRPLAPVVYRPRTPKRRSKWISPFFKVLANDNLSSAEYRTLDGPPLAPRRENSRVIKNFYTDHGPDGPDRWVARGMWKPSLSTRNVSFLPFHFKGEGKLPVRNLAHVRPAAVRKAREALRTWITAEIQRS